MEVHPTSLSNLRSKLNLSVKPVPATGSSEIPASQQNEAVKDGPARAPTLSPMKDALKRVGNTPANSKNDLNQSIMNNSAMEPDDGDIDDQSFIEDLKEIEHFKVV